MGRVRFVSIMTHCNNILTVQDHNKNILKIIRCHFNGAEERVVGIYENYFSAVKEVFYRHWRHKKDIPYDIITPLKYAYDYVTKKISPDKKIVSFPRSGKAQEIENIISEQLLDLPGLEMKINEYVKPYHERFEQELADILESVPASNRKNFTEVLKLQIDRLQTPIDGAREAALFLVVGVVGKVYSGAFCGTFSAGSAIGNTIYISQLSWFGSLWAHVFGAPAWVGWAGGVVGLLVALVAAPLLSPIFEVGINMVRAKHILMESISGAREKLISTENDAFDVAGKTAIYLQFLPDVIDAARKAAGIFR